MKICSCFDIILVIVITTSFLLLKSIAIIEESSFMKREDLVSKEDPDLHSPLKQMLKEAFEKRFKLAPTQQQSQHSTKLRKNNAFVSTFMKSLFMAKHAEIKKFIKLKEELIVDEEEAESEEESAYERNEVDINQDILSIPVADHLKNVHLSANVVTNIPINLNSSHKSPEEILVAAELRIFLTNEFTSHECRTANHIVEIYEPYPHSSLEKFQSDNLTKLDQLTVSLKESKWLSFNIAKIFQKWSDNKNLHNKGLFIKVKSQNAACHDKNHARMKRSLSPEEEWMNFQPNVMVYSRDASYSKIPISQRIRRNRKSLKRSRRRGIHCQKKDLYIRFADLSYDWIIAPPGYYANYCSGPCQFPYTLNDNSTNHSILQTVMHSMYPHFVPSACCVATSLSPIVLLYMDTEVSRMRTFEDMVVDACGCR